ncbi:MAG TPA: type I polyketide synthase, partial [Blastocatellia bacterium]|nr:type I polyketide synthase [Blastocatellia bacterium]
MSKSNPSNSIPKGVAIIGMAGRFPKAQSVEEYWRNLCEGLEGITYYTDEDILPAGSTAKDAEMLKNPNYVKAGFIFDGFDMFDAAFFGFNPKEAELMDPQHRILLECAWEALEKAGYDPESYEGRIAAYAGKGVNQYQLAHIHQNPDLKHVSVMQIGVANEACFVATQLSYKLNLKGPSMTVQTACSSSLAAVGLACQALLTYQTDMALAGAASVIPGKVGYMYNEGGISSPDGHTRSFDAKAKGTVFGNGAGLVLLKRLADAIADGDQIYAVIKGYGINNDGLRKVGFTAPSVDGQAEVVAEALAMAGFGAETISYVEAHGTATAIGDPIETAALTKAFRAYTPRTGFCGIGSVKSNIGHTDTASGVAGLIKTSLALKHEMIPRSLHFESPNPRIDFANSPFYVVSKHKEWKSSEAPRRAGVSSFGIGGTNAHVILEEAPAQQEGGPSRPWQLLLLSAKTDSALETMTGNLSTHLTQHPELNIADVAYTLQMGRKAFSYRRMLVCRDSRDACAGIDGQSPKVLSAVAEVEDPPLVFMFPGQGAQYVNMGVELYEGEPAFRDEVDRCAALLEPSLGCDLREILYPPAEKAGECAALLAETYITQPALFVVEYAIAKLLMSWGLRPRAMVGHSIGEYVAACLAGVFTLEEALKLVAVRSRLIWELPRGTMLVVNLPEGEVRSLIDGDLAVAAVNAPSLCVVSGPEESFTEFAGKLDAKGMAGRQLQTSHAFHSRMMEPILTRFIEQVSAVDLKAPRIPYISNVTGTWVKDAEATDPHYWARHIRETVRFSDGAAELLKDTDRIFVEVGPGRTLQTFIKQNSDVDSPRVAVSSLRHPKAPDSDLEFILSSMGQLWLSGVKIDWKSFQASERRLRVPLPTYPFERQRYWIDRPISPVKEAAAVEGEDALQGKKGDIKDWFYIPSWKRSAHLSIPPASWSQESKWMVFMDEHGMGERIVDRLEQLGQTVTRIRAGQEFGRIKEGSYSIRPTQRDDYDRLLSDVCSTGRPPARIVHLWSLTGACDAKTNLESFEKAQPFGFYSLLFIAQALGSKGIKEEVQIDVISDYLQDVTGQDDLQPEKTTILGPCRIIPQEYPNITCRAIDVVLSGSDAGRTELAAWLINELSPKPSSETIAYRGNYRWVRTLEPAGIEAGAGGKLMLRQKGVYLVTGGMGGIGLALAQYLAEAFQAKLALVGRSHFPPREEWESWSTGDAAANEIGRNITRLRAMEALGAEIMVLSGDVAKAEEMRSIVERVHGRFGSINGVIHSAGVPAGGVIQLKTPEMTAGTFAPKVDGTYVLDDLLNQEHLDFFVLCSSLAAELGGSGQVDYCAANVFQDAYAQHAARRNGTKVVSIGWDKWEEVGMAVKARQSWPRGAVPGAGQGNGQANEWENVTYTPADHPLLDKYFIQGDQATFVSELDSTKHWILSEHSVYGTPTVEGTAYIEMVRAAFRKLGGNARPEVKDLLFLTPFAVRPGEKRELRIVMGRVHDGYEFQVRSKAGENGHTVWQEHAMGRVAAAKPCEARKRDITEIIERCGAKEIINTSQEDYHNAESPITLGPRWRCTKQVNVGVNEGLSRLELNDRFSGDLDEYELHPALLDIATSAGAHLIEQDAYSYLPLSYKRLVMKGPLSRTLYSYFRIRGNTSLSDEVMKFDVAIMDQNGLELVEIEEFAVKRVGAAAARELRSRGEDSGEALSEPATAGQSDKVDSEYIEDGIFPREGVEVFRRSLTAGYLPQLVVSAT